jgi:hypothetical protein
LDVFACFPYLILFALAGDLEGIPKITRADEHIGARLIQTKHGMCFVVFAIGVGVSQHWL